MNNKPIGVFDSGVGGLTVLEELIKILPNENFIYVADQKNCPYGTKQDDELLNILINNVKYFINIDVKAIVIACNTASLYINELQKLTNIPIISVIEPTCLKAIETTNNKKVAVVATNMTIRKGRYQELLNNNNIDVYPVPASEFVDYIETKNLSEEEFERLVFNKLSHLKNNVDTLIHGCTHFSIIENTMKNVLGNINYIACGNPTSQYLKKILEEKDLLNYNKSIKQVLIYTTNNKEFTQNQIKALNLPFEKVEELKL